MPRKFPKWMSVSRSPDGTLLISVPPEKYHEAASVLRGMGFRRLLTVSAVDRPDEGKIEVYFLLYDAEAREYAKASTKVGRESPSLPSLSDLWPNAHMHERETWEMFGVRFEGAELKPLFLEGWEGPPPFRKDFNWREYVKEAYGLG